MSAPTFVAQYASKREAWAHAMDLGPRGVVLYRDGLHTVYLWASAGPSRLNPFNRRKARKT
jgi:hypothetical protein